MNRIGAQGKFLLRSAMSNHRLLSNPFACLRALACVAALSCTAMALAPLFAAAQDLEATEDAPAEETPAEEAPAEEAVPEEAAPEDAAPEEAPAEEASPEQATPDEAAPPEAAAPDAAAAGEAAPAAKAGWDIAKPCENYQHPYEADLCQQWRTAEAAEKTAVASERNVALTRLLMLIGGLATALLLLMFVPLLMAALAARRAARDAGASLPAVGPRDDASRAEELRAYVDVDKLEFIETPESEGVVKVKVMFRNSGQTPALRMRSATNVGIRDVADEDMLPIMPLPDNRSASAARPRLGRDATTADIVECDSTPSLADRVMNGDATIVVWGWTEYYDVFDRKQRTVFQYLCNASTLETGQIFKPMTRGDETG
jgi:hypothetical protein